MSGSKDQIAQWQRKLSDTFRGPGGRVGERLYRLQEAERIVQNTGIPEFSGYVTIGDAFFDFAIETLDTLSAPVRVYHASRTPLFVASVSRPVS